MKKVLIGCLGLGLIVVIGVGVLAYFFVIKPGMEFAGEMVQVAQDFEQANEKIENQSSFTPPADRELTPDRFERYLATQRQIRTVMEGRLKELDAKYQALEDAQDAGQQPGIGDVIGAYADIGGLLRQAKQAQVDALNEYDFSLEEYAWTRGQVYHALGQPVNVVDIAALSEGGWMAMADDANGDPASASVPEQTRELVQPHREELMELHVLAFWGL